MNLLGVVVDAVRWKAIVAGVRRISIISAVEGLLIGMLSNVVMPFKLGEGAKAWLMSRREGLPLATVMSTVLLDRAIDISTLLLFIAIASIAAPLPLTAQKVRSLGIVALFALALAFIIAGRWIRGRQPADALTSGVLSRLLDGFTILGHQHRLTRILGIALLAWLLRAGVIWCAMRAFHLTLPIAAAASVLVAVNVGIAAVAAPGNFGVFELSAAAGLALWDVPGRTALAFAIVLHAVELVPTVALGLLVQAITGASVRTPTSGGLRL